MWLSGRLVPDHKTIADFRKDNGSAIRQVCARFVALCRTMGLLTQASVAIDGSKFKAVNNRDRNFTRAKMDRRMAQIEESVARYLQQLDTADRQEPSEALKTKTSGLKEKIEKLKAQMRRLAALKVDMLATPDQQISLTDPDARSMATSGRGSGVWATTSRCRRGWASSDRDARGDQRGVRPLAAVPCGQGGQGKLGVERHEAIADRGYFSGEEILACEEVGIADTLPKPMTSNSKGKGASASRTSAMSPRRMFTNVPRESGSPTRTRARTKAWSCTATRPRPAGTCHQAQLHQGQRTTDQAMGA